MLLPIIKILLFKDTPLGPEIVTGSSPTVVHAPAPCTRVSVEDSKLKSPSLPPVTI